MIRLGVFVLLYQTGRTDSEASHPIPVAQEVLFEQKHKQSVYTLCFLLTRQEELLPHATSYKLYNMTP